ncbi:unnamed protein product [Cochlearia groenlandica]
MEKEDFLKSTGLEREEINEEIIIIDSSHDDSNQEHDHIIRSKLELTKVEMEEAKEENRRLKTSLSRIKKDFDILQTKYNQLIHQHDQDKSGEEDNERVLISDREELVLLSLGRSLNSPFSSSLMANKEEKKKEIVMEDDTTFDDDDKGFRLGIEYKALSKSNDDKVETDNDHANQETTSLEISNKIPSENSFGFKNDHIHRDHEEEILPQTLVKKTRVSVRSRCETPTMNDGCQWRKYGQKIAKGNPCPRAYYRCTLAPSCPVRKQVQRCSEDMSILISTYEGSHNHPLPMSATAMASATSAAASMLLSSSSSSPSSSSSADLHSLNFSLSGNNNNNMITTKPKPPLLQTSSSGHPTITLDLTTSSSSQQPFLSMLNRLTSTPSNVTRPSNYPTTNLNFSNNTNTLMNWSGGQYRAPYGNVSTSTHQQVPYNNNNRIGESSFDPFGRSSLSSSSYLAHTNLDHIGMIKNMTTTNHQVPSLQAETIKAITTDPSFQSALANALSSIISGDLKIDNATRKEPDKSP